MTKNYASSFDVDYHKVDDDYMLSHHTDNRKLKNVTILII